MRQDRSCRIAVLSVNVPVIAAAVATDGIRRRLCRGMINVSFMTAAHGARQSQSQGYNNFVIHDVKFFNVH